MINRSTTAAITLTASLLCSCNTVERSATNATAAAAIQEASISPPQNWNSPAIGDPITVDWLDSFGDETLKKLVAEAQANNSDLAAAAARLERSQALAKQAGAALSPAVNLTTEAGRGGNIQSSASQQDALSIGVGVNWELDLWGRLRSGARSAAENARAAEADFRYARHSLAAATADAYFSAIAGRIQNQIAQENLRIARETLRIVEAKAKNGATSAQELALARSDLANAKESLAKVEGAQRSADRALEALLGRYPSATLDLQNALPDTPSPPPAGIPSEVLERRPDLVAAERRVAAAFDALDAAKAARLPSFALSATSGASSTSLSEIVDSKNIAWQLGSRLLAPLFDGGARKAQVEIAGADRKQAFASYVKVATQAFLEVESLLDLGTVLRKRIEQLHLAEQESQEAYRIANLRYTEGESDLLDLLAIQARLNAAKVNLTQAKNELLKQSVNLHLALGGSW